VAAGFGSSYTDERCGGGIGICCSPQGKPTKDQGWILRAGCHDASHAVTCNCGKKSSAVATTVKRRDVRGEVFQNTVAMGMIRALGVCLSVSAAFSLGGRRGARALGRLTRCS
jgi:hypothetical protein